MNEQNKGPMLNGGNHLYAATVAKVSSLLPDLWYLKTILRPALASFYVFIKASWETAWEHL